MSEHGSSPIFAGHEPESPILGRYGFVERWLARSWSKWPIVVAIDSVPYFHAKGHKSCAMQQYKGEWLTAFTDRFGFNVCPAESLGLTVPTQDRLATDLLNKLNDNFDSRRITVVTSARLWGLILTH